MLTLDAIQQAIVAQAPSQLTEPGPTGARTWTGSGFGPAWTIALLANSGGSRIRMMI